MQIIPCPAPTDTLEPAPLTDLSIHMMGTDGMELSAFWSGDDAYLLRAMVPGQADLWFQVAAEARPEDELSEADRIKLGEQMASVLPLSAGRVAFPVGSGGRTIYRIWRTRGADNQGRTKIRAVRAGRSHRLPA
ncbi:MAG: hypothetical protein ABJB74_13710 [Gemmatimonas sp.]